MRSMRSHYRCVCGRTYGDKIYVFTSNEPPPVPHRTEETHKGSIPTVANRTKDASQNDLSQQAWHKVYKEGEEGKVKAECDVTSDIPVTPIDVDAESKSKENNNNNNYDGYNSYNDCDTYDLHVPNDLDKKSFDTKGNGTSPNTDLDNASFDPNVKVTRMSVEPTSCLDQSSHAPPLNPVTKVTTTNTGNPTPSSKDAIDADISISLDPTDIQIDLLDSDYNVKERSSGPGSGHSSSCSSSDAASPKRHHQNEGKIQGPDDTDGAKTLTSSEHILGTGGNKMSAQDNKNSVESDPDLLDHKGDTLATSMTSLLQQLQGNNNELIEKLSASKTCQMSLREENQRLAKHIEDMVAMDNLTETETDTSSTDTEKELEQFKRQHAFLTQELKILREENFILHQSELSALSQKHRTVGDGSKQEGGQITDGRMLGSRSNDNNNNNSENDNSRINDSNNNHSDNTTTTIINHNNNNKTTENGANSLDVQDNTVIKTQINLHGVIADTRTKTVVSETGTQTQCNDVQQLERYKTTVSNIQDGASGLKDQCVDLHKSYTTLKHDTGVFKSTMVEFMADTNKKILEALSAMNLQNDKLKQKYIRELKLRKQLQNQVVELKGNIRVFCRIRPGIKEDNPLNYDSSVSARVIASPDMVDEGLVYIDNKGRLMEFDMDKVFGMGCSQEEIFDEVSPLVRSALDGYNVCIFAYGQTGSGKTYTMEGPPLNPGINQRALQLLFEGLDQNEWSYNLTASVLEIYNETIRDLLNPDLSNKLEVKLKPEGGLHVPGVVEVPVTSLQEINRVFDTGRRYRCTASTSMNDMSSRSHCLLCVTVQGCHQDTGITTTGRLNLVDLAGSERVGRSNADGVRLEEAKNINKSLACLGDVIHALRSKQGHVPYRNSKLTYLLQDSLGGDSKTLMIVQVSPAEANVSETVCTLNFGQRVRSVEMGQATRNIGKVSNSTTRRPANLDLLLTPPSPQSPSSPASVFSSPTSLKPPPSPHVASPSSPTRQRKSAFLSSSSSSSLPSSPVRQRRSVLSSSTPSSPQLATPPSPIRQRKSLLSSSISSTPSSSPQIAPPPSSPTRQRRTVISSSTTTPSSPQIPPPLPASPTRQRRTTTTSTSSTTSATSSSPSSPNIRRPSNLSSTSSSSSTPTTPKSNEEKTTNTTPPTSSAAQTPSSPSKLRKSILPHPSSSPNLRRLNQPPPPSPPQPSTTTNTTSTTTRRRLTRHHSLRSSTSPTKSSTARSLSIGGHTSSSSSKPPIQNRVSYLRAKNLQSPGNPDSTKRGFTSSYPPVEAQTTRKPSRKSLTTTSGGNGTSVPFLV